MYGFIGLVRGYFVNQLSTVWLLVVEVTSGLLVFAPMATLVLYFLDRELWKVLRKLIRK